MLGLAGQLDQRAREVDQETVSDHLHLNAIDTKSRLVIARLNSMVTAESSKAAMAARRGVGRCLKECGRSQMHLEFCGRSC